jgi:dihydroxyacetone kinase-like protein
MANAIEFIKYIGSEIIKNKQLLTELDQAIGDGDHGINMARGFEAVIAKIETLPETTDLSTVFKTVGMALISNVGGASGPLYGTAFLRAAGVTQGKDVIDVDLAEQILNAAVNGIKERGKAVPGEKTMLDVLVPVHDVFINGRQKKMPMTETLVAAIAVAKEGIEFTKTIVATKGRASYLGERSIGHQDAGATSSYIILQAIYDYYVSIK